MALRLTEDEYRDLIARRGLPCAPAPASGVSVTQMDEKPKRSKYGNRKIEVNGMKFDSKHEFEVYLRLMQRVMAGELKMVIRQVPFDLPGGIRYIADFVTVKPDMGIEAVVDAKSEATKRNRVYINKKKQMRAIFGIEIVEM